MLRVATWNVNSIKSRLDRALAFLERHQPDVLCLQELKCVESNFPLSAFEKVGYQAAVVGQKTYNGVALLSKTPIEKVIPSLGEAAGEDARFVTGVVHGVRIFSLYIPNGQTLGSAPFFYKLRWLTALKNFLQTQHKATEPLLLTGDFNIAPEDQDVYDPEAWRGRILFSQPEKKALGQLLDFGLKDVFREKEPKGKHFSWWDYRQLGFPKNRGLRIDYILATDPLVKKCSRAWIDREERKGEKPSDHAPVLADFDV